MTATSRPRGTRDFPPVENEVRRAVEATIRRSFESVGYREVRTPTFEHLELFTAKSGEGIKKQLYEFTDKGGRSLTLRPELTAPTLRYYFAEHTKSPKPVKWYYHGPCFRYEEPQSGRYREFWQFGVELIGSERPEANAEVVAVAANALAAVGLEGIELRVGHVGVVKTVVASVGLPPEQRGELFRLIDKKDPGLIDALARMDVPKAAREALLHFVQRPTPVAPVQERAAFDATFSRALEAVASMGGATTKAVEELKAVCALLPAFGVERFHLDLGVVRGLDYYTGMVFEVHHAKLGAESQVCGGGAYALAEVFGAEPVGSIGFALGFDRVLLALDQEGRLPPTPVPLDAFIAPIGDAARAAAATLALDLRKAGLRVDMDLMGRSPSKCLDYANALGVPHVLLLGEKELEKGVVAVKDMKSGAQVLVERGKLAPHLLERRPGEWTAA